MNQNLLYIVARANVDRIYGDGRFDWIDDDWTEAVVAEGAKLPGMDHIVLPTGNARRARRKSEANIKMAAMAARTRGRRTR